MFADRDLVATQRLVDSVRWGTDVPFELLIADPGDDAAVSEYATAAADRVVAGDAGLVAARNAALAGAAAPYLVCCRPGSVVPADWASALVAAAENAPGTAVVVPDAVAASRVDAAGGGEPEPLSLALLAAAPPVVLFVSDRVRAVGGWDETYDSVGAADSDLGLRLRADGCDALHHRGVVVTERWTRPPRGASRLSIGARDRATLAARWSAAVPGAGRADGAPGPDSARAAEVRTAAASLLRELDDAAERERRDRRFLGRDGPVRGAAREWAKDRWRSVRPRLPNGLADRVGAFARRLAG